MLYNAVVGANGWKKSFCADINIFEMTGISSISLVVWKVLDNGELPHWFKGSETVNTYK